MSTTLTSNPNIRKIFITVINDSNDSSDSNHSTAFTELVVDAFTKKEERQRQQKQFVEVVCESYLFYASCIDS